MLNEMKPSLIHVIIHSFQFLHYQYEDNTHPKYTVISYPELERDYAEFLTEFELQPLPEILNTTISRELNDKLQKFCADVDQSRIYELVSPRHVSSILHRIRSSKYLPSMWSTSMKVHRLKFGEYENFVPMYPCFMGNGSLDHFYITYGFNEGYAFVFKHFDMDSGLRVFGLIEPTPLIDPLFSDGQHLEKNFLQSYRTHRSQSRDLDPICSLTGYQQFRLCSLLKDARKYAAASDNTITMERRHQKRCEESLKVTFPQLDKQDPMYPKLGLTITALPCYETGSRPSFLVSQNPLEEHSVYILDLIVTPEKEKEGRVVQHVRNIALLKYANTFY